VQISVVELHLQQRLGIRLSRIGRNIGGVFRLMSRLLNRDAEKLEAIDLPLSGRLCINSNDPQDATASRPQRRRGATSPPSRREILRQFEAASPPRPAANLQRDFQGLP
jgi:hypothetical protein